MAGRDFKAVVVGPDRFRRYGWLWMKELSACADQEEFEDLSTEKAQTDARRLIHRYCHSAEERDHAVMSLIGIGIQVPDLILERARESRGDMRLRFLRRLGTVESQQAEAYLKQLVQTEEAPKALEMAKDALHSMVGRQLEGQYRALVSTGLKPWPKGARLSFTPQKDAFLLGEPILVDFRATNEGESAFLVDLAQCNNGATRNLYFYFIATDDRGVRLRDPKPRQTSTGGPLGFEVLLPGEAYHRVLDLRRWCAFEKPGVYQVLAAQRLGWSGPGEELPEKLFFGPHYAAGSFRLNLREPTEKQMETLIRKQDKDAEPVSAVHTDFQLLHAPAYLPVLKKMLRPDDPDRYRALKGISDIQNREATWLLIQMLESEDERMRLSAFGHLVWRLPNPFDEYESARRGYFDRNAREDTNKQIARAWQKKMRKLVLRFARARLGQLISWRESNDEHTVLTVEELLKAPWVEPDRDKDEVLRLCEAIRCLADVGSLQRVKKYLERCPDDKELLRTAVVVTRLSSPPKPPGNEYPVADWLVWLELSRQAPPEEKRKHVPAYIAAFNHPEKRVRRVAGETMPGEAAAEIVGENLDNLTDETLLQLLDRIGCAAFETEEGPKILERVGRMMDSDRGYPLPLLARCKLVQFKDKVIARLRTSKSCDSSVLYAAKNLDTEKSYIAILLERMTEQNWSKDVQEWLTNETALCSSHGWRGDFPPDEARRLQKAWREWFQKHGETWRQTGPLPLDDPRLGPRPVALTESVR
jgi:hypothetical protein